MHEKGATHGDTMVEVSELQAVVDPCQSDLSHADRLEAFESIQTYLPKLAGWSSRVRVGSLEALVGQVVSQIDLCAKEAIKATNKKVTSIQDASRLMNELSVHEGFLLSAVSHSVLPRAKVEWVQAIQKAEVAKPMLARMISEISFKPYISELDGASLMQKDIRISKLSTFRQGRNPDAKLDGAVLDGLDKAVRTLSLCVGNKAPGEAVTALDSCDNVYNEMVKLLQDGGGEREVRAEFWLNVHKLLSCVRESQQATPRFQGLGETLRTS